MPDLRYVCRGRLSGGDVYVVRAATLHQQPGETMMAALSRAQAESCANEHDPDVVLTEQQFRDLAIEINDAARVVGVRAPMWSPSDA